MSALPCVRPKTFTEEEWVPVYALMEVCAKWLRENEGMEIVPKYLSRYDEDTVAAFVGFLEGALENPEMRIQEVLYVDDLDLVIEIEDDLFTVRRHKVVAYARSLVGVSLTKE